MGYFEFKQFRIRNEVSAMKVGTDGVLLGAWASAVEGDILDAGTGTGVIALMMAQRTRKARIRAIDIDIQSIEESSFNFSISPWRDRLISEQADMRSYEFSADSIVTNPPFFVDSLKSPDSRRTSARHTDTLSQDDLIKSSLRILTEEGILSVILPFEEGRDFVARAESAGLILFRRCVVFTRENENPKRLMMEFSRSRRPSFSEETLTIYGKSDYTQEYKSLTKDFYLKF